METVLPYLPFVLFFLGVLARVVVPYVQERLSNTELTFDWRYVVGQIIAALVALLPLVGTAEFLTQVGAMGFIAAFVYGWGAADVGRSVQKAVR